MTQTDQEQSTKQQNFKRRDELLEIQRIAQADWEKSKVFEVDAPTENKEKFFVNFPYPYMNGYLHLGHAFSISKAGFAGGYHRLTGKQVLFPQGFHVTGMPIKASADKLIRELKDYGNPPNFDKILQTNEQSSDKPGENPTEGQEAQQEVEVGKFKGKQSKAQAKTGGAKTQWTILKQSGIDEKEIPNFQNTDYWLDYFPPKAINDLTSLGLGIDWRRSFLTTDRNPYYDSFIRWSFQILKRNNYVIKDKRYSIYSVKDGQPCMDHDRQRGEAVNPQEYTLIKMQVLESSGKLQSLEKLNKKIYLLAATLRPETMYGQTNCWILPDGKYYAYEGLNDEIYIMTDRAAKNMAYQEKLKVEGNGNDLSYKAIEQFSGQDIIGTAISAPNSPHPKVYVLPLLTISTKKGTGIVTSVPSDSPDDYIALEDLKKKPKLREKFFVKDEWVLPFEVIPIIDIPGFGDRSAQKLCQDLKIQSQNDAAKLAQAKQQTYLKGFYEGVMVIGPHKGQKVQIAKQIIKDEMLKQNNAIVYSEPEKEVISRSGDDCIVALTDQWYLNYGEESWLKRAEESLDTMQTYQEETKKSFKHVLGWLRQWACSRSYGLGTRIPWDPVFMIESLSDSTIYMAYYTVAHILQQGNMYGDNRVINPADLTEEVWDYVMLGEKLPSSNIPAETLKKMRREFEFWYPFDLRTSGKDLINNHLTFAIYTHTAIWREQKQYWPLSIRCNGHLLLNNEKMSKSTGNFKTLQQAITEYSADALRIGLADAGDGIDDANFEESTANASILRLTKELAYIKEVLAERGNYRSKEYNVNDKIFLNDLQIAVHTSKSAYEKLLFREALKNGYYDLQKARDRYRLAIAEDGPHADLILKYFEIECLLLCPIAPHFTHYVWKYELKKDTEILNNGWPQIDEPDEILKRAADYVDESIEKFRKIKMKATSQGKKKGKSQEPPKVLDSVDIYISEVYGGWQEKALQTLSKEHSVNQESGNVQFSSDVMDKVIGNVKTMPEFANLNDKQIKSTVLPFTKLKLDEAQKMGESVLNIKLPFNEKELIESNKDYIQRSLGVTKLQAKSVQQDVTTEKLPGNVSKYEVYPGQPYAVFT